MKREQGFSLIELLIVVAIIAIIAAIAVPSMLQARMAANEASAIQGCRTVGSAEVAYAAVNNQSYCTLPDLHTAGFVDSRFSTGFNGYKYADGSVDIPEGNLDSYDAPDAFGVIADGDTGKGRYKYGITIDQIVRYQGLSTGHPADTVAAKCGADDCAQGSPIGSSGSAGS
jgi:type IV pilus assembly protein PilA